MSKRDKKYCFRLNFKRNFFDYGELVGKVSFQEESESEELVSYLLKKYIEYEVLSVAVGCMKRFDENVMEEQDALYTCFQLVESVMEGSDDPNIATKVSFSIQGHPDCRFDMAKAGLSSPCCNFYGFQN